MAGAASPPRSGAGPGKALARIWPWEAARALGAIPWISRWTRVLYVPQLACLLQVDNQGPPNLPNTRLDPAQQAGCIVTTTCNSIRRTWLASYPASCKIDNMQARHPL